MRILITGAGGMLGSAMYPTLKDEGFDLLATDIDLNETWLSLLDVRDIKMVEKVVEDYKPNIILHLAAETDVDICETKVDHAFMTNTIGTQNIALTCQKNDIVMLYISTAGVFDGAKKTPYNEFDKAEPIIVYGHSKLEGERFVEKILNKYFIIRAGWMIGGGKKDKKFVAKIIKQIKDGASEIFAVTDKLGVPTYAPDFSKCVAKLIQTNFYGTYHMTCEGSGSRYDVAKKIIELMGKKDSIKLTPVDSDFFAEDYPAPRPYSEIMCNFMLRLRGLNTMRKWEDALKEYLDNNIDKIGLEKN